MTIKTTNPLFPYNNSIDIEGGLFPCEDVLHHLGELLTEERKLKIAQLVQERTFSVTAVTDTLYDVGNISAVMRSLENFGVQSMHAIQSKRIKRVRNVSKGSEKWISLTKWYSGEECITSLKERGYKIYTTALQEGAKSLYDVDFTSGPCALVFGNEKDGVSPEILKMSDENILIPSVGMTQSFNISVAAAISFAEVFRQRVQKWGKMGDLTQEEKKILTSIFYLRHIGNNSISLKIMQKNTHL